MDYIGIDFGTSNCAVAAWVNNKPELIPVDIDSQHPFKIRSALFISSDAEQAVNQNSNANETSLNQLLSSGDILFGEKGFREFLENPSEGRYVNSPKNFLGAKIPKQQLDRFETIVVKFLSYLRLCAEHHLQRDITRAVIARPVHYHSTMGEKGNQQAVDLMQRAALRAGFTEVHFIHEPLAAAYHFETQVKEPTAAMVVDLGGGTSDISFCNLSIENAEKKDREQDILSTQGIRQGGIVYDKDLANGVISPLLGKGSSTALGKAVPNMLFSGTYSIDNLPEMGDFYSPKRAKEIQHYILESAQPACLLRLNRVQSKRLTHQLMHSLEMAKIELSDNDTANLTLDYIETAFSIQLQRDDVANTMGRWLDKLFVMIEQSINEVGYEPDIIYLTGGMGLSPLVQEAIRKRYPHISLTVADAFSSVVFGALIKAKQIFS